MSETLKHAVLGMLSAVALALVWGITGKAAFSLVALL